jgi:hypothetical protein
VLFATRARFAVCVGPDSAEIADHRALSGVAAAHRSGAITRGNLTMTVVVACDVAATVLHAATRELVAIVGRATVVVARGDTAPVSAEGAYAGLHSAL